jgi:hypothetical protein
MGAAAGIFQAVMGAQGAVGAKFAGDSATNSQVQALERNARYTDWNAQDAIKRGEADEQEVIRETKRVMGAQTAAAAAQGVKVNEGSALALQEETAVAGAQARETVKNNAWREAFGFRVEAQETRMKARLTKEIGAKEANATLLTGGLKALSETGRALYKDGKKGGE